MAKCDNVLQTLAIKFCKVALFHSAPEIYMTFVEDYAVKGYSYPVDWWSLGVLAWETLSLSRPFELYNSTSYREALKTMQSWDRLAPAHWSANIREILDALLTLDAGARVSCLSELKKFRAMKAMDFEAVRNKHIKPPFTPPKDHLNCDPAWELEEMIIETKPLHKKKKRLAKQRSFDVTIFSESILRASKLSKYCPITIGADWAIMYHCLVSLEIGRATCSPKRRHVFCFDI